MNHIESAKENFYNKLKEVGLEKVDDYKGRKIKVKAKHKYGDVWTSPAYVSRGRIPGITSAVNKTEFFINKVLDKHPHFKHRYDYSKFEYVDNSIKTIIICNRCGKEHLITISEHLKGVGCSCNQQRWTKSNYIELCNDKYNGLAKLYVIKCWNDNEEFYKIGITMKEVKRRFHSKRDMPYNYEVLHVRESSAEIIWNMEKLLHKHHEPYKYEPSIYFAGQTECFSEIKIKI